MRNHVTHTYKVRVHTAVISENEVIRCGRGHCWWHCHERAGDGLLLGEPAPPAGFSQQMIAVFLALGEMLALG